ncbi:MAG: cytochrome c biogenesis protein CcdA [Planctomycetota bacterium]
MARRTNAWQILLLVPVLAFAAASAPGADTLLPGSAPRPEVTASARSVAPGDTFEILATFELKGEYKFARDAIEFEIKESVGAKQAAAKPTFPPGAELEPAYPGADETVAYYKDSFVVRLPFRATGSADEIVVRGHVSYQPCHIQTGQCLLTEPAAFDIRVPVRPGPVRSESKAAGAADEPTVTPLDGADNGGAAAEGRSPLLRIVLAFLLGLGLSLTPCVYPTLPIAAAVIGRQHGKGIGATLVASLIYVLGFALVYAVAGLVIGKLSERFALDVYLDSLYVRAPVAVLFVVLALALFADWNVGLPAGFSGRLQSRLAGKRGYASTFGLGMVSALVVGPCVTGPLAATLAFVAKQASPLLGFWMLFAVGWGMGVPIVLLGTATGLLPRAGTWMEWFKKLFGFLMLWAALHFLTRGVGIVYKAGLAALLLAGSVFLGGFDVLTDESTVGDRLKKLLGVAAVIAAALLLLDTFGPAPRAPVAGTGGAATHLFEPGTTQEATRAIESGRPVILDFYTDDCPLCRQLDAEVFTDPQVIAKGEGLVALKIDAREERKLSRRFDVFGVPKVVFIRDGEVHEKLTFSGAKTRDEFLQLLDEFKQDGGT